MNDIHCPHCRRIFLDEDEIILDVLNTMAHKGCYNMDFVMKDFGRYDEIVEKYRFLDEPI